MPVKIFHFSFEQQVPLPMPNTNGSFANPLSFKKWFVGILGLVFKNTSAGAGMVRHMLKLFERDPHRPGPSSLRNALPREVHLTPSQSTFRNQAGMPVWCSG